MKILLEVNEDKSAHMLELLQSVEFVKVLSVTEEEKLQEGVYRENAVQESFTPYISPGHLQYVTDEEGRRTAVVLPTDVFERLVESLEEWADVRLYDESKASDRESTLPFNEAFEIIERERQKREQDEL